MIVLTPARRAAATTALYVVAASVGLLSQAVPVAVGLLVAAGCLHFLLGLRVYRREQLPRAVLLALLRDQLEEFRRNLDDCTLDPCWTIWRPCGDERLAVCVADSEAEVDMGAHPTQEPDPMSAIWSAYQLKEARFETPSPRSVPVPAAGTVQVMDTHEWAWRVAYPVFHLTDHRKVVAVVTVHGIGEVTSAADLAPHNIPALCERACHMTRRIVSVIDSYD